MEKHSQIDDIKKELRPFCLRSTYQGVATIAMNWVLLALLSCTYLLLPSTIELNIWCVCQTAIYLLSAIAISSRLRGFENLVHEASHHNLFRHSKLHGWAEFSYSTIVFKSLYEYRKDHQKHHKYLGDVAKDPDLQRYQRLGITELPKDFVWIMFIRPFLGYHHWEFLVESFIPFWINSKNWSRWIFWPVALSLVHYFSGWTWFFLYFVVPFFGILPITRWWCEASEHSGLDLNYLLGRSRNNLGFLHRWFLHPFNDGFHEVHHINASVPWFKLKEAHEAVSKYQSFEKYCAFSWGICQTFDQMKNQGRLKEAPQSAG